MRLTKTFALLTAMAVGSLAATVHAADGQAKLGQPAPAFSLPDHNGRTVNLSDHAGKVVVLEWFNDECPFVQKHYQDGHMNQLAKRYADKGVVWLTINSTHSKAAADNKAVAGKWKIDRPVLADQDGTVGKAYGATNTPHLYVIDKAGHLAYVGAIDDNPSQDAADVQGAKNYVAQALDEVVAGKPVSEPQTKAYGCTVKYKN
ncbi:MAG TPA: thioredoxin family protein [Tepidisphaeraceae bacterium]|nr:thioredoxin family protein [Tepidisphaeraceae bacterium]